MKEFNEFVAKMKEANELKKKIEAKIREDSRIQSIRMYDTMVSIYTTYHIAHYEPVNTGVVTVEQKNSCSEALLNPESPEEYDELEHKLKEEAKWLDGYIKELFGVKIEEE
jgi:single-stranded DNA-specific DHH superfamily exonuclease